MNVYIFAAVAHHSKSMDAGHYLGCTAQHRLHAMRRMEWAPTTWVRRRLGCAGDLGAPGTWVHRGYTSHIVRSAAAQIVAVLVLYILGSRQNVQSTRIILVLHEQ